MNERESIIEIDTQPYNERRYSKPWIAKVTFPKEKPDGQFAWGHWVGQEGDTGLLSVAVQPGDVVAQGQKDYRKPRNSAPDWFIVQEDLSLLSVSKVEAYKHWRERDQDHRTD